jgi:hypothetical protein
MSSAAEAKQGALYINAWETIPMQLLLKEMGLTPIQTDNSTAHGMVTNNIQPRCTKAMDMRFHWLHSQDAQGQFQCYWHPVPNNQANYGTKHYCAAHHIKKHPTILTSKFILDALHASTQCTPATMGIELMKLAPTAAGAT